MIDSQEAVPSGTRLLVSASNAIIRGGAALCSEEERSS
jgi:hypothetical protein